MSLNLLSLREIVSKIRSRELKVIDVAEHFSQNIKSKWSLNAMIYFNQKQVLDEATKMDKEADAGKWRGRLHGAPLVIKDNIHVKGIPNTAGTPGLANFVPRRDAPIVRSLRQAGALFMGKANMHELAFGVTTNNGAYGPAKNPHNPEYSSGGSSGGTGSAVAAHLSPAGLGSDTGGSVRIPASVNGICGLRPTLQRYSQSGITPMTSNRDTAGPMALNINDLILIDEIITGETFDETKLPGSLKGLRFGISLDYLCADLDPQVSAAFDNAKSLLQKAGAILVEVDSFELKYRNSDADLSYLSYEMNRDLSQYLIDYNINMTLEDINAKLGSPDVKKHFAGVLNKNGYTLKDYLELIHVKRPALKRAYQTMFAKNNLTALVFPTLCCLPAKFSETNDLEVIPKFIRNMDSGSQAGIPGLSIPMGKSKEGLPIGLEFDGLWNSDQLLIRIGQLTLNLLNNQ